MNMSLKSASFAVTVLAFFSATPVATAGHMVGGDEVGMAISVVASDVDCQTAEALQQQLLAAAGQSPDTPVLAVHGSTSCRTPLSVCVDFADWQAVGPAFAVFDQKIKQSGIQAVANIVGDCLGGTGM